MESKQDVKGGNLNLLDKKMTMIAAALATQPKKGEGK